MFFGLFTRNRHKKTAQEPVNRFYIDTVNDSKGDVYMKVYEVEEGTYNSIELWMARPALGVKIDKRALPQLRKILQKIKA